LIFDSGEMQTFRKLTGIIICTAFILQSCIYEYFPKAGNFETCLVIYGMITTENGPHEITISKTYSMKNHGSSLVDGAKVSLSDDAGNTILLMEDSIGRYLTSETFAGQIGTKYKLNIELQDGKQYESEYVELLDVPGIAGLNYEYIVKPQTVTAASDTGYQFYINTDPGNSELKYFKWEIIEDFEYHLNYFPYYWDGESLIDANISNICYDQSHLNDIFVGNTNNSQTNCLTNYPFCFNPISSKFKYKFRYGYGINVRQYALSEFSYDFWKGALENNLPDPMNSKQSYQLTGNFKCISNPDEPVFGIFEASAVKVKGIQVKIYYGSGAQREIPVCNSARVEDMTPSALQGWYPGWVGISTLPGAVLVRDKKCVFCEYAGGTSIRPEYWEKNK
jgi:hypothetical protein